MQLVQDYCQEVEIHVTGNCSILQMCVLNISLTFDPCLQAFSFKDYCIGHDCI